MMFFLFSNPHIYNAQNLTFFLHPEILHGLVNGQEQLTLIEFDVILTVHPR